MKANILKLLVMLSLCVVLYILYDALISMPAYKYRIISENHGYKTNKYEVVNSNCIKFVDRHNQTITICGEYEIIENK
jgi:hypothetical protein